MSRAPSFDSPNQPRRRVARRLAFSSVAATLAVCVALLASCGDDPTRPDSSSTAFVWPTATPAEQGFDGVVLDTLTARLERGAFGHISSVLIVRNGYLVYEEYFRGMSAGQMHPVYSVTKSVASALVGIAVDKGLLASLDQPLLDYFPAYRDVPAAGDDLYPRERITLRHVLEMRAGFEWDELSVPYGTPQNPYTGLVDADDMFRYTLDRPVVDEPGTRFCYNTGTSTLLTGVIEQLSGQNVRSFALEHLFEPLDISFFSWNRGPGQVYMLGSGLEMLPRDMAKFGYLYATGGIWQGRRLISSEWIEQSWRPCAVLPDGREYGLHWWLQPLAGGGEIARVPYALGWGGQYVMVVPELAMVVVSTAEAYRQDGTAFDQVANLIGEALQ